MTRAAIGGCGVLLYDRGVAVIGKIYILRSMSDGIPRPIIVGRP